MNTNVAGSANVSHNSRSRIFQLFLVIGILHILLFVLVLPSQIYGNQTLGGDQHYYRYASRVVRGEFPYRDFFLEYPPFALIPFTLPRLLSPSPFVWEQLYTWQILLWDLLGIAFISWVSLRLGRSPIAPLGAYTLGLITIGPLITWRFDLLPAVLALMALAAYGDKQYKVAWATLALSVVTKVYALVLAPLFVIDLLRRRQFREIAFGVALLSLSAVIFIIALVIASPHALSDFLDFHRLRDVEIESFYANINMLAYLLASAPIETSYEFWSVNVQSPLLDTLAPFSLPIFALALLALYAGYYKNWNRSQRQQQILINYATCAILIFMVCNKVLSPQYFIWLLPLIPLTHSMTSVVLFGLAAALTTLLYPTNFEDLISMVPWAIAVLTVRNLLLLILFSSILKASHADSGREYQTPRLTGLMRRLNQWTLAGFLLAFPLIFLYPALPSPHAHLPPDLDGDGAISDRERFVAQQGGVDYDADGVISDLEHHLYETAGLDTNGDQIVDGDELRYFLDQEPR